jgi:hypothetical protein
MSKAQDHMRVKQDQLKRIRRVLAIPDGAHVYRQVSLVNANKRLITDSRRADPLSRGGGDFRHDRAGSPARPHRLNTEQLVLADFGQHIGD